MKLKKTAERLFVSGFTRFMIEYKKAALKRAAFVLCVKV